MNCWKRLMTSSNLEPHNRKVGRFFTFENSPGISSGLPIAFGNVRSVAH